MRTANLICLSSVLALSCQSSGTNHSTIALPVSYHGWGFDLSLADGCEVGMSEVADFNLYHVSRGDVQILFMYAGWHPSFPKKIPKGVSVRTRKVDGKEVKGSQWNDADGIAAEYLIRIRPVSSMYTHPNAGPAFVHCIYSGLTPDDATLAEAIVNSIQITRSE